MIVDLLRNDLGRVARFGSVRVEELFAVERYPTLWQMTSTVSAELRPDVGFHEIFRALFPCGSITGAPKVRAMQLIAELEEAPRGVYTGAIGFFSPRQTVFNVAIRTLELDGARGTMGVGSGIVIDSDPAAEYRECLLKAEFLTGLGASSTSTISEERTDRQAASRVFADRNDALGRSYAAIRCWNCISTGSRIRQSISILPAIAPRSARRWKIMRANLPIRSSPIRRPRSPAQGAPSLRRRRHASDRERSASSARRSKPHRPRAHRCGTAPIPRTGCSTTRRRIGRSTRCIRAGSARRIRRCALPESARRSHRRRHQQCVC